LEPTLEILDCTDRTVFAANTIDQQRHYFGWSARSSLRGMTEKMLFRMPNKYFVAIEMKQVLAAGRISIDFVVHKMQDDGDTHRGGGI